MDANQILIGLPDTALAFRGYNITNLGRSQELLAHAAYGPTVRERLRAAGRVCSEVTGRKVDLVARVRRGRETTLKTYAEAIALIVAMEMAQLDLLQRIFEIDYRSARLVFGYSLGEITAAAAAGMLGMEDVLRIPLSLAGDCADLAKDVTLGILFSRGGRLPTTTVRRMCVRINQEGRGVMGISTYLAPNSMLLMGQEDTLDRFQQMMKETLPELTYLRKNRSHWPPMHTPIIWERHVPNRAGMLMHTLPGGFTAPHPPLLSLVTGKMSYNDFNAREILQRWTDHPQRLWDAVYETLAAGITTVIHVGPQPNLIPATYKRLRDNVEAQTKGSIGMRALSAVVRRPWLQALLPQRTALLRAPAMRHVTLEDWLLEQKV